MDDKKREEIRKEAKSILDNFSKALLRVKLKRKELKKKIGGFRKEGQGLAEDKNFRKRMFSNAPSIEGDCLIAERKKW